MKLKIINIKSLLTSKVLREHIFNFFRGTEFNSQFINIIVKVSGDNDSIFYSLSNIVTINVNNLSEKITFVNSVEEKFNNLSEEYESTKTINNKIFIYYDDVDIQTHRKYQRNISLFKKVDIENGILPINNIPYNTNYKGWGNFIYSNDNSNIYIVNNLYFDNNINYISVNEINFNLIEVTIYYKDGKTLVFSDLNNKKDHFKRTFNNGKVVYFVENNPFFFFDSDIQKPVYKKDKKGKFTKERLDVIKPIKSKHFN